MKTEISFAEFKQCIDDALSRLQAMRSRDELPEMLLAGDWLEQMEEAIRFPKPQDTMSTFEAEEDTDGA